jgi:hypothetical protein
MRKTRTTNRKLLKTTASGVLASFRSSTYPRGYASGLHSVRPCWTTTLNILVSKRLYRKELKSILLDTAERAYAISSSKCFKR